MKEENRRKHGARRQIKGQIQRNLMLRQVNAEEDQRKTLPLPCMSFHKVTSCGDSGTGRREEGGRRMEVQGAESRILEATR